MYFWHSKGKSINTETENYLLTSLETVSQESPLRLQSTGVIHFYMHPARSRQASGQSYPLLALFFLVLLIHSCLMNTFVLLFSTWEDSVDDVPTIPWQFRNSDLFSQDFLHMGWAHAINAEWDKLKPHTAVTQALQLKCQAEGRQVMKGMVRELRHSWRIGDLLETERKPVLDMSQYQFCGPRRKTCSPNARESVAKLWEATEDALPSHFHPNGLARAAATADGTDMGLTGLSI